jgi:Flp pilus assembly protein TadB
MNNENLSAQESLQVIQSMIDKTKTNLGDNSIYFLLWGWLVFIACILQYILMVHVQYPKHYYAWMILFIGIIFSIIYSLKYRRKRGVKTYVGSSMSTLWTGLTISFMALPFILSKIGWNYAFPVYILFYATGTFISGGLLQFKPLQMGGIVCWILAVAATFVSYQNQILLSALAILVSYLIPGYLLKNKKGFKPGLA